MLLFHGSLLSEFSSLTVALFPCIHLALHTKWHASPLISMYGSIQHAENLTSLKLSLYFLLGMRKTSSDIQKEQNPLVYDTGHTSFLSSGHVHSLLSLIVIILEVWSCFIYKNACLEMGIRLNEELTSSLSLHNDLSSGMCLSSECVNPKRNSSVCRTDSTGS